MHTKFKFVVGHLTLDDTVLPDGTTIMDSPGGAALYAAAGALLWDGDIGLVSQVGFDYSKDNLDRIIESGIDVEGIKHSEKPTIHIWALYDRHGERYFIPQKMGGNYFNLAPHPEDVAPRYLEAAGCHIAPMPFPIQKNFVTELRKDWPGVICLDPHHEWVDPEKLPEWKSVLTSVDVFMPSEDEFIHLFDIPKQEDIEAYLEQITSLSGLGLKVLVLKLGARGALIFDYAEKTHFHVESVVSKLVDVTGAGDAFCGGFMTGYINTGNAKAAAAYGAVSSSIIVENFGALEALKFNHNSALDRLNNLKEILGE